MHDLNASGNKSIQEVEELHHRVAKLEQVDRKPAEPKSFDEELDKAWVEWEKTFDATEDSIMIIDRESKIIQANFATSRLLGKPLEEIDGKTCWQIIHETDKPPEECPLKKALYSKNHEETELYVPEKDIWLQVSADPILDDQGSVDKIVHVMRDITKHKQAEKALRESEEKYRAIIEDQTELICRFKPDFTLIFVNESYARYWGKTPDELVGVNFQTLIPEEEHEKIQEHFKSFTPANAVQSQEHKVISRTGEICWQQWSNRAFFDEEGRIVEFQSVGRDITDRKQAEEKLIEYQARLKSLTSEILCTEERERHRIAIDLHDTICQKLVMAQITLQSLFQQVSESSVLESLRITSDEIGDMIDHTDDLMHELNNPILHELGLVVALQEYLDNEVRQKHGIAFELDADEQLKIPPVEFRNTLFRVSRELLMNVVKHAGASNVKVSVRKRKNQICIRIQDNGMGFEAAGAGSNISKTCSFGLFSVREQLEHLGGKLTIESRSGRGTTARVIVPVEQDDPVQK